MRGALRKDISIVAQASSLQVRCLRYDSPASSLQARCLRYDSPAGYPNRTLIEPCPKETLEMILHVLMGTRITQIHRMNTDRMSSYPCESV